MHVVHATAPSLSLLPLYRPSCAIPTTLHSAPCSVLLQGVFAEHMPELCCTALCSAAPCCATLCPPSAQATGPPSTVPESGLVRSRGGESCPAAQSHACALHETGQQAGPVSGSESGAGSGEGPLLGAAQPLAQTLPTGPVAAQPNADQAAISKPHCGLHLLLAAVLRLMRPFPLRTALESGSAAANGMGVDLGAVQCSVWAAQLLDLLSGLLASR